MDAKFLLTGVAVGLLASCGKPPAGGEGGGGGMGGPMPVMTVAPESAKLRDYDEFTGRIDAVDSVEIRPRVTGYVQKVHFTAGQMVQKGDPLFTIDPRWHEAEHRRAVATVAQAKAALKSAESEANRAASLLAAKAISTEEADARRNGLALAQANVLAAEAALDTAALDLDYTVVKAPVAGRVSRAMQTEGNYVSGVAGFTTLLTNLVSVDPMYVYVSVPENRFLAYQRLFAAKQLPNPRDAKVAVEVKVSGEDDYPHKGFIDSFDNRLDPASGSVVLRASVPNPQGILVPGAFAKLRMTGSAEYEALLVDEKLIQTDQDKKYVLLFDGGVAKAASVKLGASRDGKRIVLEGLKPTDAIIASGLQMLREGAPVMLLPVNQ